jgi:hypothetical protein
VQQGKEVEMQVYHNRSREERVDSAPLLQELNHTEAFEKYHFRKSIGSPISSPDKPDKSRPPKIKTFKKDHESPAKILYPPSMRKNSDFDLSPQSGYE